jgi:hypothetical protein
MSVACGKQARYPAAYHSPPRVIATYNEDTFTRKQISLRTKQEPEALALLHSKNEAYRQPVLNLKSHGRIWPRATRRLPSGPGKPQWTN